MFWKRKQTIDWVHLVFWAALFVAVMSAVALIVLYCASVFAGDWLVSFGSKAGEKTVKIEATAPGVVAVAANYEKEINNLAEYVSSTPDVDETVRTKVKEKLNEMRVPSEKRDGHLSLYLKIEKEFSVDVLDRTLLVEELHKLLTE